jgi:hypothetical protein
MQKLIAYTTPLLIFLGMIPDSFCQNVGIGVTNPANKLQVSGSVLINVPVSMTGTAPTPAQTTTMINGNTFFFPATDSTGRIYDPGGPAADYIGNLTGGILIMSSNNSGIEITLDDVQLGTGDSLLIKEYPGAPTSFLAIGNGYSTPGKWIFNSAALYIFFKSNNDASNGRGFSLLFRRLYDQSSLLPAISGYTGNAFFFDAKNGSVRSGLTSTGARGDYSVGLGDRVVANKQGAVAMGSETNATGIYSTASGNFSIAGGNYSTAMGYSAWATGYGATAFGVNSTASGDNSLAVGNSADASALYAVALGRNAKAQAIGAIAIGEGTTASGQGSTAIGYYSTAGGFYTTATGFSTTAIGLSSTAMGSSCYASGDASFAVGESCGAFGSVSFALGYGAMATGASSMAFGRSVTASGTGSIAMGNFVSTSGFSGCLTIGDNSTTTTMQTFVDNGFRSRFAGGYRLFSNSAASIGVFLNASGNSWAALSDVRLKENFLEVDGEDFLRKIAVMPLTTWNYIGQDTRTLRHYGPMAQDFYKAFGKDALGEIGCDTLINQQDFLGVNLIAIQALEKRTQKMEVLAQENIQLKKEIQLLEKRLDLLEQFNQKK